MSTSTSVADEKPAARIRVDLGEDSRELFMSFGLLNEVASLAGGPEGIPELSFNPTLSTALLEILLAKRDKRGNIVRPEGEDVDPIVPLDLDPEVAEQIIDWAGAHALDFFVRRFAKSARLLATKAGDLAAVGSSLTSSGNSAGKTA